MNELDIPAVVRLSAASIPFGVLMLKNDADRAMITELYFEYRELMYRVGYKYFGNRPFDIEDAMSAALEDMCAYAERFKAERCGNRKAYVLSVMGNACRRQLVSANRADGMRDYAATWDEVESVADVSDAYDSVFDLSDASRLLDSFDGLSEKERELIRMRHLEDRTYGEMAVRLKMSEGAVRTALTRAKRRLRELAADRGEGLL